MNNRGFLYGDGFFETIRIINGTIPLLDYHLLRISEGMDIFQFEPNFDLSIDFFTQLIQPEKNWDAVCRISFYRDGGGRYKPENNQCLFDLQYSITDEAFQLPNTFDLLDFCKKMKRKTVTYGFAEFPKPIHPVFSIKSLSSAHYVTYALEKRQKNVDILWINSPDGFVLEELVQNFLLIKNGEIFMPPIQSGMVVGVALRFLMHNFGFMIQETNNTKAMLLEADQILLCNAVKGIIAVELIFRPSDS